MGTLSDLSSFAARFSSPRSVRRFRFFVPHRTEQHSTDLDPSSRSQLFMEPQLLREHLSKISRANRTRGFCVSLWRNLALVSNGFIFLFAILLISLGGAALHQLSEFDSFYKYTIPAGAIVLGIFLLFAAVFGCGGAYRQSPLLLAIFVLFVGVLIVCLWGVGGGSLTTKDGAEAAMANKWNNTCNGDLAKIEKKFDCCGWTRPVVSTFDCERINKRPRPCLDGTLTHPPCRHVIASKVEDGLYMAGVATVLFACFTLIAVLASLVLIFMILRERRRAAKDI